MKLYEVPRNSRIKFTHETQEYILDFHHLDGMYSYCTDLDGNVVHLGASTEVEIVSNEINHV